MSADNHTERRASTDQDDLELQNAKIGDAPDNSTLASDHTNGEGEDGGGTLKTAEKPRKRTKKWVVPLIVAVLTLALGAGIGIGLSSSSNGPDEASSSLPDGPDEASSSLQSSCPTDSETELIAVGCFLEESQLSLNTYPITCLEGAKECRSNCPRSRFFGVTKDTCYCFRDESLPKERLDFGTCKSKDLNGQQIELYINTAENSECSITNSRTVRDFLTEENDAEFGFDIISNKFRNSPFDLTKSECGTNIYTVQTEVSEGAKTLSTSVSDVSSFAEESRTERTESISASAEVGYKGALGSASVKVSGAMDSERTNLFKSSGASEVGSKLFRSFGVKRLVEIDIDDFDNRYHFITLSEPFGRRLNQYLASGFDKLVAFDLIFEYGQFVVTRGIFGGYIELRTTMTNTEFEDAFENAQSAKECYELSVEAQASVGGFSGSVAGETKGCESGAESAISSARNAYSSQFSELTTDGGEIKCDDRESEVCSLLVTAASSKLLTTKDKYPKGDEGLQLRLLSDFLDESKIDLLAMQDLQITEKQFAEIRTHLQQHILEYLEEAAQLLDECGCTPTGTAYLEEENGSLTCVCYEPHCSAPALASEFARNHVSYDAPGYSRNFGDALAMDGDTAVISDVDFVVVYVRRSGKWEEEDKIEITNSRYYRAMPVALDGDTLVIGLPLGRWDDEDDNGSGFALVYSRSSEGDKNSTKWVLEAKLKPEDGEQDDRTGMAVAISGNVIAIGSPENDQGSLDQGAVYIYTKDANNDDGTAAQSESSWSLETKLVGPGYSVDYFGDSVAMEGNFLVVGTPGYFPLDAGAVFVYERVSTQFQGRVLWEEKATLLPPPNADQRFGSQVDLHGDTIVVTSSSNVFAFRRGGDASEWVPEVFVQEDGAESPFAQGDGLGKSVSIYGDLLLVSSHYPKGSVFLYHRSLDQGDELVVESSRHVWKKAREFAEPESAFGSAVALDFNTALIGSPNFDAFFLELC